MQYKISDPSQFLTGPCISQGKLSYAVLTGDPQIPVAYNRGSVPCSFLCPLYINRWLHCHYNPRTKEKRIWQRWHLLFNLPPGSNRHPLSYFPWSHPNSTSKLPHAQKKRQLGCCRISWPAPEHSHLHPHQMTGLHENLLCFLMSTQCLLPKMCCFSPCFSIPSHTSYHLENSSWFQMHGSNITSFLKLSLTASHPEKYPNSLCFNSTQRLVLSRWWTHCFILVHELDSFHKPRFLKDIGWAYNFVFTFMQT